MDVDEQGNDELLDFDEEQEFFDGEGAAYGDEQLDYGEEAAYEEPEGTAALEGYQGEPAQAGDDADAEYLEGLEGRPAGMLCEFCSSWPLAVLMLLMPCSLQKRMPQSKQPACTRMGMSKSLLI